MLSATPRKRLSLATPSIYRINVQGYLEEVWSDRLAGMKITMNIPEYQNPVTTLVGKLKDQSELIGVLNGLYELRMPILSVEYVDHEEVNEEVAS